MKWILSIRITMTSQKMTTIKKPLRSLMTTMLAMNRKIFSTMKKISMKSTIMISMKSIFMRNMKLKGVRSVIVTLKPMRLRARLLKIIRLNKLKHRKKNKSTLRILIKIRFMNTLTKTLRAIYLNIAILIIIRIIKINMKLLTQPLLLASIKEKQCILKQLNILRSINSKSLL